MLITLHLNADDYEPRTINGQYFVPERVGAMHPIVKAFERKNVIDPKYVITVDLHRHELVLIAEDYSSVNIPLPSELFLGRSGYFTVAIGDRYDFAFRPHGVEHRRTEKVDARIQRIGK